MAVLNLPLAHYALKQEKIPEWAKKEANSVQSMKGIHELVECVEVRQTKAQNYLARLNRELESALLTQMQVVRTYVLYLL